MTTVASDAPATAVGGAGHAGAAVAGFVLFLIAAALAISVDVVRVGYGIKGDEATYVSMALSVAYDGDLSYERRDLERFWGLYRSGPEGVFLKRGKSLQLRGQSTFPFVRTLKRADPRTDRLYFGKAFVYPVFASPFVRLFGLNGLLLFHVLMLGGVCACGYLFLAARSSPAAAAAMTTAFVGAAAVPIYGVFLTPEVFNFSIVFFAYFLWLYDPRSPGRPDVPLRRVLLAVVLLGLATYSKPTNGLLAAPPVLALWWNRRWTDGLLAGILFVATTAGCFGLNAAVTGEFNYQGGDRKTFYSAFPFDAPDATWERRGISVITDGRAAGEVLEPATVPARFARNVEYFLIGRHFGFVPYYFPGALAILLWLLSRRARREVWRGLTFAAMAASVVAMLLVMPYTWSGGGGPPGNRYFLGVYPTLFFLIPPLPSAAPGVLAWAVGALFTAKMLVNPFVAAKFPYQTTERGAARRLPVELTMANDLPIMLDPYRSHLLYGQEPARVLLYYLDNNASTPEPGIGIWVGGGGRADILVRASQPVAALRMTVESPIHTTFTASAGGPVIVMVIAPQTPITFDVPVEGVRGWHDYSWLLSVRSSDGFVPHLFDPASKDSRNLGALMRFSAIVPTAP